MPSTIQNGGKTISGKICPLQKYLSALFSAKKKESSRNKDILQSLQYAAWLAQERELAFALAAAMQNAGVGYTAPHPS
jgi:hypothetical protein